jgi:hypothetical protein
MSEEVKKVKKPKSKARKIIEWVLTGIFVALFAVIGIAQIDGLVHKKDHYNQTIRFGYGTFVVETDSMERDADRNKVYGVKSAIITYLDNADKIYSDYLAYKGTNKHIDVTFYDGYAAYTEYTTPLESPELTTRTPLSEYPIITHRVREIHINENAKLGQGKYTFIVSGINPYSKNFVNLRFTKCSLDGENVCFRKFGDVRNFFNRPVFQNHFLRYFTSFLITTFFAALTQARINSGFMDGVFVPFGFLCLIDHFLFLFR